MSHRQNSIYGGWYTRRLRQDKDEKVELYLSFQVVVQLRSFHLQLHVSQLSSFKIDQQFPGLGNLCFGRELELAHLLFELFELLRFFVGGFLNRLQARLAFLPIDGQPIFQLENAIGLKTG